MGGFARAIDPCNLPFLPGAETVAPRYQGLHDVLRDACPDAWVQALLRREHNLPLRYDRNGHQRHMCISAASLLQAEYPGLHQTDRWSYPRRRKSCA